MRSHTFVWDLKSNKKGYVKGMDLVKESKRIVSEMSLDEKAAICSGANFWELKEFEHLGLKKIMLTDGPHGLRKQAGEADHLGINKSVPATSFPTAATSACSWDPELIKKMGEALGEKCIREDVAVILGPGVNMKRSPLCGRNFEYFSEDPFLAGEIASEFVAGVQSRGVGTSLKHFAANDQETARMSCDSVVDERALHEIYLTAFEKTVKKSQPWTVMCCYNKVNGTFGSDNKELLSDILRASWGFEGLVVSDWGANNDRVNSIKAGMDLEMPCSGTVNERRIKEGIRDGRITFDELNRCVERIVRLYLKAAKRNTNSSRTEEDDNVLAREIAEQSMVLLKNECILPLSDGEKVLFVGEMAKTSRYQGAGSSKINPSFLDNALDKAKEKGKDIQFALGWSTEKNADKVKLVSEAVNKAKTVDKVVVFAGLTDEYESEGYDRENLFMPQDQVELIEEIVKVNKEVVVVLQCGSPIVLPFKDDVKGILLSYLSGQASGEATINLLYGKTSPSGKLAETWPNRLEDTPSYKYFPGDTRSVEYRESIFIGYRYYDTAKVDVAYPFGYGLSYSEFEYSNAKITEDKENEFTVCVDIKNIGEVTAKEIVEVYVSKADSSIWRASKELKGFKKIELKPGEKKTVEIKLDKDAFRYYNVAEKAFCVENGKYEVHIGSSVKDIKYSLEVNVIGDGKEKLLPEEYKQMKSYKDIKAPFEMSVDDYELILGRKVPKYVVKKGMYTESSTINDIKDTSVGKKLLKEIAKSAGSLMDDNADEGMKKMANAMLMSMPLRAMTMTGAMTLDQAKGMAELANGHLIKGLKLMKKR